MFLILQLPIVQILHLKLPTMEDSVISAGISEESGLLESIGVWSVINQIGHQSEATWQSQENVTKSGERDQVWRMWPSEDNTIKSGKYFFKSGECEQFRIIWLSQENVT